MDGVPAEDNASSHLDHKQPLREEVEGGSCPQTTPTEQEIQLTEGDTCRQATSVMAT